MKNENYQISLTVNADAKKAFENICNVAGWWTGNIEGNSKKLNDVFTVHFGETFVTFEVTQFKPYTRILWLVTDCNLHWLKDKKEWKNTIINWQVSENNDSTTIVMTHIDLIFEIECYESCEKGWNFFTGESLKKLINEGKGMPDTPANKRAQAA